jgi:hypothetical protein
METHVECPTCYHPVLLSAGMCPSCGTLIPVEAFYEETCATKR